MYKYVQVPKETRRGHQSTGAMWVLVLTDKKIRNDKHTKLSLQRDRCITCFPPKRLEMYVPNRQVTSARSVWPGHEDPYLKPVHYGQSVHIPDLIIYIVHCELLP